MGNADRTNEPEVLSTGKFLSNTTDDALELESLFQAIIKFDGDENGSGHILMLAHLGRRLAHSLYDRVDQFSLSKSQDVDHV